jgi:DNA-directed RNA polymerase
MGDELGDVYRAINTLQDTPWVVNKFVLKTFQALDKLGLGIAGLKIKGATIKPPSPLPKNRGTKELTASEKIKFSAWKKRTNELYNEDVRLNSKRLLEAMLKELAEKFSIYERIYFPQTMDFRGRMYPSPMYLNPQGNSLAKGQLKFADGKPLGSEEAMLELAIHGANCFGYDKASMQDRFDWVLEHSDRIFRIAEDPLNDYWWAKEADSPWTFLAFCEEWAGFKQNGLNHLSYLSVNVDATCSGLQHLSAALRDPIGAQAVNLIPQETPADVYQMVIENAIKKVEADVSETPLAQIWLDYGMTRKTSKRCTMTRVYGSTLYSAREFIEEYITDTDEKRLQENSDYISPFKIRDEFSSEEQDAVKEMRFDATVYLAKHIWGAINETVVAAKDAMDWLREPIKNKLDSRRQANGISPNWVHANDACHARMTLNLAGDQPVPITHFSMIHDSYGTHACDVPTLNACIRETFIQMYSAHNPLEMFLDEARQLTDAELPELPEMGDLDISQVRESEFFFS